MERPGILSRAIFTHLERQLNFRILDGPPARIGAAHHSVIWHTSLEDQTNKGSSWIGQMQANKFEAKIRKASGI